MDPYDSNLFSRRYSKYLPGLVGAGLGSIAGALSAGRAAYKQVKADSQTRFVTWKEKPRTMMKTRPLNRPRYASRMRYRTRRYTKPRGDGGYKRIVRTTSPQSVFVAAAATTASGAVTVQLNTVVNSDISAMYRLYRIKKVVVKMWQRVDPANSGLANNYVPMIAMASDPEDITSPANVAAVTAYDNSYQKPLPSGDVFTYTFYPKCVNAVGNAGATAYVGSYAVNPWLQLGGTGVTIPHQCLKYAIQFAAAPTVQINFDYFLELHFDVKGQT